MKELIKYLKDIRVLYVEDQESIREEIEFFLENRVKNLYVAKNGEEGFSLYKEYLPDIIITDIQMPKLDGIEMSRLIKNHNKDAIIVVISAFNDSNYLYEAINLHITNYLTKPLDLKLLLTTLATLAKNINLEKENKNIISTLSQYKEIVDERSIVSKTDLSGKITYTNKPFENITGYSKEELMGKSHSLVRHEDTKNEVFIDLWKTILNKKTWSGVIKNKKKNGDYYIVDTIIKPILDVNGNILEFIALRNDITELESSKEYFKNKNEKSTKSLKESIRIANSYKSAIEESNIIMKIGINRDIIYANDSFYKISGYTNEELIGMPYSNIKKGNLSDIQNELNLMFNTLNKGEIYRTKITNIAKNGSEFHCNATVFPLYDKNGNVIEYMNILHDITEIENLHNELEETQRDLIYRLGEVGETRSKETGNHVKRVAEYSKLLAKKVGLDEIEVNAVFMASPMHDIGKIGIPDHILNKPGKLDLDEWNIMKTHSEIGFNILKSSERLILKAAAIISYTHHEKWDGSGYPRGLCENDIHIYGRITAIADVFDALGSDRIYKKAWKLEDILNLFNEQKGKHFDPSLIDLFMNNLSEFLEIRDRYND